MKQVIRNTEIIRLTRDLTRLTLSPLKPKRGQFEIATRNLAYCPKESKQYEAKRLKANKCDNKLCTPPPPPPKPGFWKRFFSCEDDKVKPPLSTCRKRIVNKKIDPPDLSFIDGQPFRTCGEAYIVQKDLLPVIPSETSRETRLIKKIEQPLHCLLNVGEDPLDKITSAELRLIALHDRKLHPSYKQLDTIPKQVPVIPPEDPDPCSGQPRLYNTISGPLDPNDIPIQLKFNRELLDKKNIMYDFKRVEPPMYLVAPIIEMRKNQRPTLEKKRRFQYDEEVHQSVDRKMEPMNAKRCAICTKTTSASFDTLQQGNSLLDSMVQMGQKYRHKENAKGTTADVKTDVQKAKK